jgi:hypothetical protein
MSPLLPLFALLLAVVLAPVVLLLLGWRPLPFGVGPASPPETVALARTRTHLERRP